jgi:WD40 repeat protein
VNYRERTALELKTALTDTALADNGRQLITTCANGTARVWDAVRGEPLSPWLRMNSMIEKAVWSWDGSRFVTVGYRVAGDQEGAGCLWDSTTFQPVTPVFRFHNCRCMSDNLNAKFSADGKWLAVQSRAETFLFDTRTGAQTNWPMQLKAPVITCAFSPDTNRVALYTGVRDPLSGIVSRGEVRIWDLATGQALTPPLDAGQLGPLATGHVNERDATNYIFYVTGNLGEMYFSPDGRWLVTSGMNTNPTAAQMVAGGSTRVQVWDARTGQARSPVLWPENYWCWFFFTPDSSRLYVFNDRKVVHLWDFAAGQTVSPPWLNLKSQDLYWYSSDGQLLITKRGFTVRLWDAITGEPATPPMADWSGQKENINWLTFGREAMVLLVRGNDWVECWPLPRDPRPWERMAAHVRLLAARRFDTNGAIAALKPSELPPAWALLSTGPRGDLAGYLNRSSQWHERAAKACEREKQWFAAGFHLDQLLNARPKDRTLKVRLAKARREAALEILRTANKTPARGEAP